MELLILGVLGAVLIGLGFVVQRHERLLARPLVVGATCGASSCHAQACQSEPCQAQPCQSEPCRAELVRPHVDLSPVLAAIEAQAQRVEVAGIERERARVARRQERRGSVTVQARLEARAAKGQA
jgi:hypothetical protein